MFNKYDAYKDSCEGWIGLIPNHWEVVKLKHLFTEKKHKKNMSLSSGSISFGDVVYKDDEKITEATKASYQEVLKGEFLLNPLNLNYDLISLRIALSKINVVVSAGYIVLLANNLVYKEYFKYLLHRYDVAYMKLLGSGVRQTISFNHIANSLLPYPSMLEQKNIAEFLDQKTSEIDQAIAIKEQQIALLNERKQIVIQKAVTQGLNSNVAMKDSGVEWIGKIPEHWECKPSRYAFRAVKRFKRDGSEIKFSVTQKWGVIPTDEMKENSTQAESFGGFQICLADDLVLNKYKAHLGVFWRAPSRGLITGNYTVFEPLKGINSKYFELLYHTPVYIDIFRTIVYGIVEGMMPLYNNDFYDMLSVVPPLHEQLEIVKFVEEEQEKFASIEHVYLMQIEKLKEYKTTLINDAVTGKIKVA